MPTIRRLLSDFEMALEDYSAALARARSPTLTTEEWLELSAVIRPLWERIKAIQGAMDRLASTLSRRKTGQASIL
jgi:hypothetical protein